uniref:Pentraxin (PTX) domain-containing protein n=1 Tax=Laticauda laticaudata TaxID=8630 RepID=A0A8C5S9Q1_LATLA
FLELLWSFFPLLYWYFAYLQDQVFLFPKRSTSSYVLLKPSQNREMERFTISHNNEILIFKEVSKEKTSHQAWEDLCLAWDSATGIMRLWLNRVPLPCKVIAKGYRIQWDLVILLGQDQDSYGGSLDTEQAFEGELGNICLWDTVLSADQMRSFQRQEDSTPLLDWLDLSYEIKGEVMVVPSFL